METPWEAAQKDLTRVVLTPEGILSADSVRPSAALRAAMGNFAAAAQGPVLFNGFRRGVPGCHASGFIALVYPLISAGLLAPDVLLSCYSLTGYSGGGKKMIAEYRAPERSPLLNAPRQYALGQTHKHLKEMKAVTGLASEPVFCPVVADFYSGMQVTVPLFAGWLKPGAGMEEVKNAYKALYTGPVVSYTDAVDEGGFQSAAAQTGLDSMKITVAGNEQRMLLLAVYDNLGKGASGAAVECMNLVTGAEKTLGLEL